MCEHGGMCGNGYVLGFVEGICVGFCMGRYLCEVKYLGSTGGWG